MERRPFWKDPIVVVGASLPTLILAVFGGYLWTERSAKVFREHIHAAKAEAESLSKAGKHQAAYKAWGDLIAYAGGEPSDAQARADWKAARAARVSTKGLADAEAERELLARELTRYRQLQIRGEKVSDELHKAMKRLDDERSEENLAAFHNIHSEFTDVETQLNAPYLSLLREATKYFKDDAYTIGLDARGTCERLNRDGYNDVSVTTFIEGGIYLSKNTSDPSRPFGLPAFRAYAYLYDDLRRRTKFTHQEAIEDLHNRQKL